MPAVAMKLLDREHLLTVKIAGDSRLFSKRISTMLAITITSSALLSAQSSHSTYPVAIYRGDESLVCTALCCGLAIHLQIGHIQQMHRQSTLH